MWRDRETYEVEAARRRRLALSARHPLFADVAQALRRELDAFEDRRLGVWLFPNRAAIDRALAMVAVPAPAPIVPATARPVPLREIRTRRLVQVGRVYRAPAERVAEGWPARFVVERVRSRDLPDGGRVYVAAVRAADR